jgi:hypothetical protein
VLASPAKSGGTKFSRSTAQIDVNLPPRELKIVHVPDIPPRPDAGAYARRQIDCDDDPVDGSQRHARDSIPGSHFQGSQFYEWLRSAWHPGT